MDIIWILPQIIATPFGLVCILFLSELRFTKRITVITVAVFIGATASINFFAVRDLSYLLGQYPFLDFIYRLSNILFVTVIIAVLVKQRIIHTTFNFLSSCVCVLIVDTAAIIVRVVIGVYFLALVVELLLYPLMLLLVYKMRRPFMEATGFMKKRLLPLSIIPALIIGCFFLQVSIPVPLERAPDKIPVAIMLCILSAGVYGVLLMLFKTLYAQSRLEQNVTVMNLHVISLEHQNEIISQNEQRTLMFRHDLRHITQLMSACADNDDMAGVRELLSSLDKNLSEGINGSAVKSFTGHKLSDVTLSYYIDLAKKADIDIMVSMDNIGSINVDKTEFAVVMSNALENAVIACEKIPNGEKRICVDGRWQGQQFFLEIANTYTDTVNFDSVTGLPVSNEENHGLGSHSIYYFAQKYGASLDYRVENGWFHFRLLMRR